MATSVTHKMTHSTTFTMVGVTGNPQLNTKNTLAREYTTAIDQVYLASNATLAASGTITLDLTTGLLNPLRESISSADAFDLVVELTVIHEAASLASAIVVGNAGSNPFGGLLTSNADTLTLPKNAGFSMWSFTTKMTVDGSNKNILITNSDAVNAATYSVIVKGLIA